MQDAKGNKLAVGSTVLFDLWDDDKKNPTRIPTRGVVKSLAGESLANQTLGEVTIKHDEGTITLPALAVTITDAEEEAAAPAKAPAKSKKASAKTPAANTPATPPAA